MSYTYTKLGTPTTIRLIKVMPDKVDDVIACTIHTYDTQEVDQEFSYRALSYCWGDPHQKSPVFLKDDDKNEWHEHGVHESLMKFIHHVWEKKLDELFWTDFLCLDQSSQEEKGEQLPRMGVIYAKATETVIWLGLSEIEETRIRTFLRGPGSTTEQGDHDERTLIEAIHRLYQNKYWTRVWIIQEVVLAKKATVMMRSFSIDLGDLESETEQASPDTTAQFSPSIYELEFLRSQGRGERDWWFWLEFSVSKSYQCTFPQDQVYGMLGLVKTPEVFQIDYTRPSSHVILDAMFECGADPYPHSPARILDVLHKNSAFQLTSDVNELEEYLNDKRTLPRHQELAALALQTFDAMSSFMVLCPYPLSWHWTNLYSSVFDHKKRYIEQEAIFFGLALSIGTHKNWKHRLLEDWKTSRRPRLQMQSWKSPWRCKVHYAEFRVQHIEERLHSSTPGHTDGFSLQNYMQQYDQEHMRQFGAYPCSVVHMKGYMQQYARSYKKELSSKEIHERMRWYNEDYRLRTNNVVVQVLERDLESEYVAYDPRSMKGACAQADENCDGSEMVFAIPHRGFRMTIANGTSIKLELFQEERWGVFGEKVE